MSLTQESVRNQLLSALPRTSFDALGAHLTPVDLPNRAILQEPGRPFEAVHFIESGYVSLLITLEDGDAAEVGMIGREGLTGLSLVLGVESTPVEMMIQNAGSALRMPTAEFRAAVESDTHLRTILLRYAQAFQMQITMTAACNNHHRLEQRIAKWLLLAHDRADGDNFAMTHEFLSMMLGVRRPEVTVVAGILQKAGLIRYSMGCLEVTDRPGLEAAACECHPTINREYARCMTAHVRR